jgi:saccharopine dehydrogenase-like NADP-dependent oxidoreductase
MLADLPGIGSAIVADAVPDEGIDVELDVSDQGIDALREVVRGHDAVVSALPFHLNKDVATVCAEEGKSYFDFTEDTDTTAFIRTLGPGAREGQVFAPQCGLAPGAINIIGAGLVASFDHVRSLELRVGALPLSANNQMKYYLSWSSAGLINEYLQPCDALYRGQQIKTQPLDGLEEIVIDGVLYEAFNTSGGVATLTETLAHKVDNLDYKTIRYPGHRAHLQFVIKDLGLGQRPELLTQVFEQEVPLTSQDVVILYANAVGTRKGRLHQRSFIKKVEHEPAFTAIQKTTAAGMAAVIELWAEGKLAPGFLHQSDVAWEAFLATRWGRAVYGS